jgi:AcrR family transcriptional regulator
VRDSGLSQRAEEIVRAARELLEEEGIDGLSMRRLAERLGIRAPSIYKHLPHKQALENALISDGFERMAAAFMTERELDRPNLQPGAEERAARPIYAALGDDQDLARAAFAFAHGMTILELNNRFPPGADIDAAWRRGLDALRTASATRPATRLARDREVERRGR